MYMYVLIYWLQVADTAVHHGVASVRQLQLRAALCVDVGREFVRIKIIRPK
jgi:hypothetical protein